VSWDEVLAILLNVNEWNAWFYRMEVVGVVFIATNNFLAVALVLPTANGLCPWSGRPAPAHQGLKSQQSVVTAISTAIVH
jgi:hypothetical protein